MSDLIKIDLEDEFVVLEASFYDLKNNLDKVNEELSNAFNKTNESKNRGICLKVDAWVNEKTNK